MSKRYTQFGLLGMIYFDIFSFIASQICMHPIYLT
jgi:hypothetical protein